MHRIRLQKTFCFRAGCFSLWKYSDSFVTIMIDKPATMHYNVDIPLYGSAR